MENQTLFKKISKIIIIIIIFLVVAVGGYLAGGIVKYGIDIRKSDKVTENFQNALEQPFKDDVYGGKTPEETWAMYIDALKKGDIELASKYAAVDKQREIFNKLQEAVKLGRLESSIKMFSDELKKDKDYLLSDKAYYYIPVKNINGEIESYPIIFYINPYTEVWKIISL